MAKPILITGGAGFIGTHLCRRLVTRGEVVRVFDIRKPSRPVVGVEYMQGDVRDLFALAKVMAGARAVFHFAAVVSVPLCQENLLEGYSTNLTGTLTVLEALKRERERSGQSPRLIFASSAAVYGQGLGFGAAIQEEMAGPPPQSFYGCQKLASEHAIQVFSVDRQFPAVILRFFNVYGIGQDPKSPYSGVITVFSDAIKAGQPLRLNGGGVATRDFVSVHDIVHACENALDLPENQCTAQPINLGSGQSTSIRELAHLMIRLSGKVGTTQDMPPRLGDLMHSLAELSRAREVLKWGPRFTLEESLREVFD